MVTSVRMVRWIRATRASRRQRASVVRADVPCLVPSTSLPYASGSCSSRPYRAASKKLSEAAPQCTQSSGARSAQAAAAALRGVVRKKQLLALLDGDARAVIAARDADKGVCGIV